MEKSELDKPADWNDSFSMQLQRPAIIQEQRLKMNAQLLQSIKLMELPIVDLRERIEEEIEKNPALEMLEDRSTVSIDDHAKPRKEEFDYFEATSDSGFVSRGGEEAADEHHRFIEGALSHSETLQEHLLWQLRLAPVDTEIRRIGERLIQNLNEDGFHKEPLDVLLKNENPKKTGLALKLVQSLDPQGCASSNYQESLRVQIGLLPDAPEGIIEALDYLEILERGKTAEAAKILNRTEDEIEIIFKRIKELSPFPGRGFSSADIRFVVPDVRVIKKEGEFAIVINDEEIPVLGINPFFTKMSDTKDVRDVRDFARENIKEARVFIQSIKDRNHTLKRVTGAIVEFQRAFFANGPRYVAPLTQRDIAQELGLNESTISRTANGKYVETEWGIFELRHFFTNSISGLGSGGSRYSKAGVKELIRELVQDEGMRFSDQELTDLLSKRGIPLARRTVAKYRKELDLGSSYAR